MSIFNSLGSNYNFRFVIQNLFASNNENNKSSLVKMLKEQYGGEVSLVYKGREALRLALRIIGKPKDYVIGICGFTCFAVNEAVVNEGYKLVYLDIENDNLNFGLKTVENTYKKNPKLKILIIQNTLGYPCDIEKISRFCKEKDIILIEDLAHSIGAKYQNGKEAGTVGDFTALSFSQDKMIDGISGGALIIRDDKFQIPNSKFQILNSKTQIKDRLYPLFTLLIRKTYGFGVGKLLHLFLKKINLLSKPVENIDRESIHELPNWYCKIIYSEFVFLDKDLNHKKKIASIYFEQLNAKVLSKSICSQISNSSNLRFPIFVDDREDLIRFLKKYKIFISDIWYDAPIAPKKYLQKTNYQIGECSNAENIASKIINLPTHRNVTEDQARLIVDKINLWLK